MGKIKKKDENEQKLNQISSNFQYPPETQTFSIYDWAKQKKT